MTRALTPDRLKLESAGVKSVKSRTGLIKEVLEIGVYGLRSKLERLLTNRIWELKPEDILAIEEIERTYRDPEYLYGKKSLNEKISPSADASKDADVSKCTSLHSKNVWPMFS